MEYIHPRPIRAASIFYLSLSNLGLYRNQLGHNLDDFSIYLLNFNHFISMLQAPALATLPIPFTNHGVIRPVIRLVVELNAAQAARLIVRNQI